MRMDSEMIGILLSDSMHYTIVVSLEMSDEPKIKLFFYHVMILNGVILQNSLLRTLNGLVLKN